MVSQGFVLVAVVDDSAVRVLRRVSKRSGRGKATRGLSAKMAGKSGAPETIQI